MFGRLFCAIKRFLIESSNDVDYRADFENSVTNKSFLTRASTGEYIHQKTESEWQNFRRHAKIMDESI